MTDTPMAFIRTLAACALLLAACPVQADFSGMVIRTIDGDTVDILVDREPIRVRLAHIDAPEKKQAFGTNSRHALAAMVNQKAATIITAGTDCYGSTIGTVLVDGRDINRADAEPVVPWAWRATARNEPDVR